MHPPRPKRTTDNSGLVDHLADWLVTNCPFSTLTTLTLLVVGTFLPPISRPVMVAIPVVLLDLSLVFWRRARHLPDARQTPLQ